MNENEQMKRPQSAGPADAEAPAQANATPGTHGSAQYAPPVRPPKRKRHFVLSVLGIAFLLMLLGQIIGEVAILGLRSLLPPLKSSTEFLFQYLSFIGIDAIVLIYCDLWDKDILHSFLGASHRGQKGNTLKLFLLGILVGSVANGLCILVAWLHGDLHFSLGEFPVLYLLCAFLCVLVQSGAEELITRGYMMGALLHRYPAWVAIGVNSLFFAALHLANPGFTLLSFMSIALIGLALSLIAYYMDSLWMCIAIHTAWNFTQNFLFGLPNSGIVAERSVLHLEAARSSFFYNAAFGVEGAAPSLVVELLMGLGALLYVRYRARKEKEDQLV